MEDPMHLELRRSDDRGQADHGWLRSRHTFSFADYRDPRFMGFGALRVINEDRVAPGGGFGTHPHRDMEIVSYVVAGALAHRDTLGTGSVIRPGDVQLMRAGRGISHSEMNASQTEPVHFLQIWILPAQQSTEPGYQQRAFPLDERGLRLVVSPDGRDGSLTLGQDADIHRALLDAGQQATLSLRHPRAWVQLVRGALEVNGQPLQAGDGLAMVDATRVDLVARHDVEALVFDLV
jgi:quercetin 2,3-dioxygenase